MNLFHSLPTIKVTIHNVIQWLIFNADLMNRMWNNYIAVGKIFLSGISTVIDIRNTITVASLRWGTRTLRFWNSTHDETLAPPLLSSLPFYSLRYLVIFNDGRLERLILRSRWATRIQNRQNESVGGDMEDRRSKYCKSLQWVHYKYLTLEKKFVESTELVCREEPLSYLDNRTLYAIELFILQFETKNITMYSLNCV